MSIKENLYKLVWTSVCNLVWDSVWISVQDSTPNSVLIWDSVQDSVREFTIEYRNLIRIASKEYEY